MFVCACKSFDPVSEGCGDLMLFRLISLPPHPPETCLRSHPSILFTAPLHPYRTNDHGSGQLLNAVVSSVLLSDSSSIAPDGTQTYLLHSSPPAFSRSTNMILEHLGEGAAAVRRITASVFDNKSHHEECMIADITRSV